MDQKAVFEAIASERDYQDRKWGTPSEHPHEVGGWLTLIATHLRRAQDAWASANSDAEALTALRKVLAVGVACGEQTRYVKPWRKRLPRSPMNCSASEVVAAQQEEIAEWRDGHALQPLGYEQIVAIWSKHMKTRALPNYEDFARDIEAAHGIGVKNGPAGTSHVSSET